MHFYRFSIGDYRRDTAHLSLLEHGVYRQLLDTYYLNEEPIPADTNLVCRRMQARSEEEREAIANILSEFFTLTERGWEHARCDAEIAEYHDRAERARENGRLGGRARKNPDLTKSVTPGNQGGNPDLTDPVSPGGQGGCPELSKSKANHKPVTNNQKPKKITAPATEVGPEFEAFWSAYPKKLAKAEARESWAALSPDADLVAKIMRSLAAFKRSNQWREQEGRFIPHATTWLNQHRWEDEVEVTVEPWEEAGAI